MCISPSLLYALVAFPISKTNLEQIDVLQRKMLRRIIGWRRVANENWHDTMTRMNARLERAHNLYPWKNWSYAGNKWRFIHHILSSEQGLWSRTLLLFNFYPIADPVSIFQPKRSNGRPRLRWDDCIQSFCDYKYEEESEFH